jgi:hypothetical protein
MYRFHYLELLLAEVSVDYVILTEIFLTADSSE